MNSMLALHQLDSYSTLLWTWSVTLIPHLVTAGAILVGCFIFSAWLARSSRALLNRTARVDLTIRPVIVAAVRYAILILGFIAALGELGVQTASLLAVLGAAGLAIGLALQGTLTNIAAGIMLLWLRPFEVGDYLEVPANNISGIVKEIGLFICRLENVDGIVVIAPNSAIWNSALRNYTANAGRLVSLAITLPAGADLAKARQVLTAMLEQNPRVLKAPPPLIFVESYSAAAMVLCCGFRVSPGNLGNLQRSIIEDAKRSLDACAMTPQQITRTAPVDADPSRLLEIEQVATDAAS